MRESDSLVVVLLKSYRVPYFGHASKPKQQDGTEITSSKMGQLPSSSLMGQLPSSSLMGQLPSSSLMGQLPSSSLMGQLPSSLMGLRSA